MPIGPFFRNRELLTPTTYSGEDPYSQETKKATLTIRANHHIAHRLAEWIQSDPSMPQELKTALCNIRDIPTAQAALQQFEAHHLTYAQRSDYDFFINMYDDVNRLVEGFRWLNESGYSYTFQIETTETQQNKTLLNRVYAATLGRLLAKL